MVKKYNLYLDESETHDSGDNRIFCIAGVIIEEENYNKIIVPELSRIKKLIWSDLPNPEELVLHEKDVRFANNRSNRHDLHKIKPEFHRFQSNENTRQLYTELGKLYHLNSITVIGACVSLKDLDTYFHRDILSDKYLICMQILLENYCHFLQRHNGYGHVFYESREEHQDKEIRMRFNHIMAIGSMYINPYAVQRHLTGITFPTKFSNIEGLQIADFVPNDLARKALSKKINVNKKNRFNISNNIRKARYDGGLSKYDRFGFKIMP